MSSKFLNLSTDTTLGGSSASDEVGCSQKAIKTYVDNNSGGGSYTAGTGIDITSGVISVTSPTLTNTATGTNSLTIVGTASTAVQGVNIGVDSSTLRNGVAIGYQAQNTGSFNVCVGYNSSNSVNIGYSIALGGYARTTAAYAIQLGYGTNSEANSFYVATSSSNNWKMLGSDGLIPAARLPISVYVVETYHSGADWYRVYSDGWCEQGGTVLPVNNSTGTPVTLHKQMADTNYSIQLTQIAMNAGYGISAGNISTTGFNCRAGSTASANVLTCWEVKGYVNE